MNERIRELAGQASFDVGQIMAEILCPDYYGAELYKLVDAYTALPDEVKSETVEIIGKKQEKFAELIVRECVGVINDASVKALRQNTFMGDDVPSCIHESNILKHFGVKE